MRRLVILRPEPGGTASVERATAAGIDAIAMPLFAVEPVEWQLPDISAFDAILLTSANAVRSAGGALRHLRALPVHAVGDSTAAAAREAGLEVASSGDSGVERLLDSIDPALRLLHLCGEHRTEPRDRGRNVTHLVVYRSAELPAPAAIGMIEGQTVAVHSPRAGQRLAGLCDQAGVDRASVRVAAISAAAAAAAGDGWERIEIAANPDDAALLALAARLCDKAPQQ